MICMTWLTSMTGTLSTINEIPHYSITEKKADIYIWWIQNWASWTMMSLQHFKVITISCFTSLMTHSTQRRMCVCLFTLTCLPPGGLQWPRAERPVGCSAESQAQRREQQHGRDQCRVCGPQRRPSPHDCGRHFRSRGRDHHHRAQMGCQLPHSSSTGKGGSSSSSEITYLHFGWGGGMCFWAIQPCYTLERHSIYTTQWRPHFLIYVCCLDSEAHSGGAGQEGGAGPPSLSQWQRQPALPGSHNQGGVTDPTCGPSVHPTRGPQWHQVRPTFYGTFILLLY